MASLILVSDMDGTLLDDSSRIPPENIAAIRELIAAGGAYAHLWSRQTGAYLE